MAQGGSTTSSLTYWRNEMFPPPMRERQHVKVSRGVIPSDVIRLVTMELVQREGIQLPNGYCEDFWEWNPSPDNPYGTGSWVKRLKKWCSSQYGKKISDEVAGLIGDMVGSVMNCHQEYWWDVTDTIDWDAGDFGDDGSCFWGCNRRAKDIIMSNGGLAIRCYDGQYGAGIARAWVAPLEDGLYVLFNGYGKSTRELAHLVASVMDIESSVRRVGLCNHGSAGNTLYINSGVGYLVGPSVAVVASPERIDLMWGVGENYHNDYCINCGDDVQGGYYHVVGDEVWCDDCFYDHYYTCDRCDEPVYVDDAYHIDDGVYCEYCAEYSCQCDICYERHWNDNMIEHNDRFYCEYCRDRYLTECFNCEEYVLRSDVLEHGGDEYCQECYNNKFIECAECGNVVERSSLKKPDRKVYRCPGCRSTDA